MLQLMLGRERRLLSGSIEADHLAFGSLGNEQCLHSMNDLAIHNDNDPCGGQQSKRAELVRWTLEM